MDAIVLRSRLLSMILAQFGVQKNLFPPIMEPAIPGPAVHPNRGVGRCAMQKRNGYGQ